MSGAKPAPPFGGNPGFDLAASKMSAGIVYSRDAPDDEALHAWEKRVIAALIRV
jgi:hypothetical protein